MSTWTTDDPGRIAEAAELDLESERSDGSLREPVTIWVVRAGDGVYVRSVKGRKWVRGIEYMTCDRRGFWEERGYHNIGGVQHEQRYSYQQEPGEEPEL